MKQLLTITLAVAALTLTACEPAPMIVVDGPDPAKPACVGDTVLIDWFENDTPCDLTPPQILVKRMPDLTAESRDACHRRGGNVLVDNQGGTAYCLNLDY